MRSVTTNFLVRLIARDDEGQVALAEAFVQKGAWVSHLVLVEMTSVLAGAYEWTTNRSRPRSRYFSITPNSASRACGALSHEQGEQGPWAGPMADAGATRLTPAGLLGERGRSGASHARGERRGHAELACRSVEHVPFLRRLAR